MGKRYSLVPSNKFKKDLKGYKNHPMKLDSIKTVINLLADSGYLGIPLNMRPHKLSGKYNACWECHILPDLLIIWKQEEEPINEIYLIRAGSHSELFN